MKDALDRDERQRAGSLLLKVEALRPLGPVPDRRSSAYSLDVIEHGLLRHNRRPPPTSAFRVARDDDPRLGNRPGALRAARALRAELRRALVPAGAALRRRRP